VIEGRFAPRTKAELEAMAGDRIALTPTKRIDEVVADPRLAARDLFVPVRTADPSVTVFGSPMQISATPVQTRGAAPERGQHNRAVRLDRLGIDAQRFDAPQAGGTI
jgi:crotonobetainyl-CoA:carnitine CoA-transferase CaiB-like acyl-CoA transferase